MKGWIGALVIMAALFGAASAVIAQGRDAADRSLRLDRDAIRSDIRQDRLKQGPPPEWLLPQGQPRSKVDSKKKAGASDNR